MKLLIILPGTPVNPAATVSEKLILLDTLTQGKQYFANKELQNNLQTVEALRQGPEIQSITVMSFSERKNPLHLLRAGLEVRKIAKQITADAVYVFWGGISAWAVTLLSQVPVIVALLGSDLHGSYTRQGKKTFFGQVLSGFSQLACDRATGIVVMSQKMKEKIKRKNQHKILVLPEGVNMQKFYPLNKVECRERLGWKKTIPTVIFFYRGVYVKNAPLARDAFRLVKLKMPEAELIEVDGVANEELIYYYNAADLLLLTSFHEGSNNSIKEALACNCPVVATNAGDAAERLKGVRPSYCVPEYDAALLSEKMLEILKDPQRSNGREFVKEVSIENVAEKLSEFLMNTVKGSQAS